jgi:hypothetical protein
MFTQILTYIGFAGVITLGGFIWKLSYKMATIENDIKNHDKEITRLTTQHDIICSTLNDMKLSITKILTILEEREKANNG